MIEHDSKAESARLASLGRLVAARGIGSFAPFLVTGEGEVLPNGDEEASGYVLDDAGRVFRFWIVWDAQRAAPTFTVWDQVAQPERWGAHPEYLRARESLGLR